MKLFKKLRITGGLMRLNFYGFGFFSRSGFADDVYAENYKLIDLDDIYK